MTAWVALLRGVNVGGITIRSVDLAGVFRDALGFDAVRTFLASGNVRFESADRSSDRAGLKTRIESALRDRFGYEAWIVLLDQPTLARIVEDFPFEADREGWHPYVLLSSDPASLRDLLDSADGLDTADEGLQMGDGVLYWHVERGRTLDSPFGKLTGKAKYKSTTTNRNLRTLRKLL